MPSSPPPDYTWKQPPTASGKEPNGRRERPRRDAAARLWIAGGLLVSAVVAGGMAVSFYAGSGPETSTSTGEATRPAVEIPTAQTQRRGEWSPICAKTKEPLIDFSPVDHGTGTASLVLTVHNCSDAAVEVGTPSLQSGKEWGELPTSGEVSQVALAPYTSARLILTWDAALTAGSDEIRLLEVRIPDIGEGTLNDTFALRRGTPLRLSGWIR